MEILIIGNGFDLAHKLPTQYKNFLDFTKMIKQILIENIDIDNLDWGNTPKDIKNLIEEEMGNKRDNLFSQDKMWKVLIENNMWVEYFQNCSSSIGENWIDFELEISKVIKVFDELRQRLMNEEPIEDLKKGKSSVIMRISKAAKGNLSDVTRNTELFDKFLGRMELELNHLIRALEIYLVNFVGKINISNKVSEIEKLSPDHVLSFNYTDTYKKIYGHEKNIKYDYVHGQANITNTIDNNNMVLGIDEYLPKEREKEIYFVAFKKYYQRILKETGCKYLDWVGEIVKQFDGERARSGKPLPYVGGETPVHHQINNLYIFGHSLDETDKDILQSLICNDNVHTKIFYLNNKVHAKQVANLVKVIGPHELIKRTGGPTKTIEFIKQK